MKAYDRRFVKTYVQELWKRTMLEISVVFVLGQHDLCYCIVMHCHFEPYITMLSCCGKFRNLKLLLYQASCKLEPSGARITMLS